jgi:hypothetical protein
MSPDTDVFLLALRYLPDIGKEAKLIHGSGTNRREIALQPIYDVLGDTLASALPAFHSFTGSDTTGKFSGKGKLTCWNALNRASPRIINAFAQFGKDEVPSQEVMSALEEFGCQLYLPKSKETEVHVLR